MDFHRFSLIFMDFHGFPSIGSFNGKAQPAALIETFARFQAAFLSSDDFHRSLSIFIDFHRFSWIAGLVGLARLARLAGRFGFLALLEAGLNHGVPHARRQDGSAD